MQQPEQTHKHYLPTVDIIVRSGDKIVVAERKPPPYGWALPGGFVDHWESVEDAKSIALIDPLHLDKTIVFDHREIVRTFMARYLTR